MYQLVMNFLGSEEDILSYLGFGPLQKTKYDCPNFLDDEEFDD